jgi:hypothetical protein
MKKNWKNIMNIEGVGRIGLYTADVLYSERIMFYVLKARAHRRDGKKPYYAPMDIQTIRENTKSPTRSTIIRYLMKKGYGYEDYKGFEPRNPKKEIHRLNDNIITYAIEIDEFARAMDSHAMADIKLKVLGDNVGGFEQIRLAKEGLTAEARAKRNEKIIKYRRQKRLMKKFLTKKDLNKKKSVMLKLLRKKLAANKK